MAKSQRTYIYFAIMTSVNSSALEFVFSLHPHKIEITGGSVYLLRRRAESGKQGEKKKEGERKRHRERERKKERTTRTKSSLRDGSKSV